MPRVARPLQYLRPNRAQRDTRRSQVNNDKAFKIFAIGLLAGVATLLITVLSTAA